MWRLIDKALPHFLVAFGVIALGVPAAASNNVVKRFQSGLGLDAVGMVDASEDTEVAGPQAIYVGENGNVYLLDQVNNRVLQFDPKDGAGQTRSYELPRGLEPTDLIVTRDHIMVWDGNVHALRPSGPEGASTRGLEEISTRAVDDEFTVSAFAQMGSQRPSGDTDLFEEGTRSVRAAPARVRQAVASRGEGPVIVDVVASKSPALFHMDVRRQDETNLLARLKIQVRDRLGAAEFLEIDNKGRMFVLVENVPQSRQRTAAAFVVRFSAQGRLEAIYDIPLSESVALSRRFVAVSPDGDVYFLRTRDREVDVVGVGYRAVRADSVIDSPYVRPTAGFPTKGKGFIAAVRPLTREQVVKTAFAFESVQWQLTPSAYGADPDTACTGFQRIRRPRYLIGKLNQYVRGVPYCWGCHGSLAQIGTKVGQGTLAGNVCTRDKPRRDVAGVDCSAFVSAAWGLARHFTTVAIPSITDPLDNAWDLRPGDALNRPGSHVMLFLRFTADRKAEVIEASPGSCNGRVCRNVYPLASLLARGYTAVRFRALANDMTQAVDVGSKQIEASSDKPRKAKNKRRQGRR
jgi:hypothetical protein